MLDGDAHWCHLANTIESSMCGGDAAFFVELLWPLVSDLCRSVVSVGDQQRARARDSAAVSMATDDATKRGVYIGDATTRVASVELQQNRACVVRNAGQSDHDTTGRPSFTSLLCLKLPQMAAQYSTYTHFISLGLF